MWGHQHFYSKKELYLVCKQIGFSKTYAVTFGKSKYKELNNLDYRKDQKTVNSYIEIVK